MISFESAVAQRGLSIRRHSSKAGEYNICCPFCGDRKYRLGINIKRDKAHCFNCGWGSKGGAVKAFFRKLQVDIPELIDVEFLQEEEDIHEVPRLPEDFYSLSPIVPGDGLCFTPKKYLLSRGVCPTQIERKRMGACLTGKYAYRVVVPVRYKRELRGLVCRDWTGTQEPKYLNSTGTRSMYNLLPKNGHKTPLNISEGVFKALALEKTLGGYSAALLGHDITDEQVEQVLEQGHKEVLLWPDPDKVGVLGMIGVAERLTEEKIRTKIVYPFPSADADEMGEEEIWDCWENRAVPFTAMLSLMMKHQANCL